MNRSFVYLNPIAVIKVEVFMHQSDAAKIKEAENKADISGLDLRLSSQSVKYAGFGDESDGYLVVIDEDEPAKEMYSQWYEADGETPMPPSSLHRVHLTAKELGLVRSGLELLEKIEGVTELLNRLPEDTDGKK